MIINTAKLNDKCTKILNALDSNSISVITETLQIKTCEDVLSLRVTNGDYVVEELIPVSGNEETLNVTVKASVFLKLVCQTTTDTISLNIDNDNLTVIGNGTYKLPVVMGNDKMLEIPEITINNETTSFEIPTKTLISIANINSKELQKVSSISKPVQKMYYIDQDGCITFTTGACVNNFKLDKDIKILLNNKIVKLFKLFDSDMVKFTLGYDLIEGSDIIQGKVRFETNSTIITAVISNDESLINSVPSTAIRKRAYNNYPYSVVLDKSVLLSAINRLLIVIDISSKLIKNYGIFEFTNNGLVIYDSDKNNKESLYYNNEVTNIDKEYVAMLDIVDLKFTLENSDSEYVTLNFGDHQAFVCVKNNVYNIIPEVKIV